MNKFQGTALAVLAAGLMTATAAMANDAFDARLSSVIAHVKADPGYKSLPLSTASEREWFFDQSKALYTKQITKEQYVADGNKQFPGYEASFNELAGPLTAA